MSGSYYQDPVDDPRFLDSVSHLPGPRLIEAVVRERERRRYEAREAEQHIDEANVCPVARRSSGLGLPAPHMWMLLERQDFHPPNAPAAVHTLFVFFCQWCLTTTTRTYEELPIVPRGSPTHAR